MDKNVNCTNEYQEYRKQFDYIFNDEYEKHQDETIFIANHQIKITYYSDDSHKHIKYHVNTTKIEIYNSFNHCVAEFTSLYPRHLFEVIEHSNGKTYLIFSIDLYGYSILDLSNYQCVHYIPESSFNGTNETFIWTDVYYCNDNNLLAVGGCYWASTGSTEIFDFSTPEEVPYKRLFNSFDLEQIISIDDDINPLKWNEDGSLTISCYDNNQNKCLKTVYFSNDKKDYTII